jgi:hypothetical protein
MAVLMAIKNFLECLGTFIKRRSNLFHPQASIMVHFERDYVLIWKIVLNGHLHQITGSFCISSNNNQQPRKLIASRPLQQKVQSVKSIHNQSNSTISHNSL